MKEKNAFLEASLKKKDEVIESKQKHIDELVLQMNSYQ